MKHASKQSQKDLETLLSKHQLLPVLREQFLVKAEEYPEEKEHKFVTEVLVQIYLHRQASPETMVGILSPKFGEPQEVADKLLTLVGLDYLDYHEQRKVFTVLYDVSDDVKAMLDRYQYPLPMVSPPNQVQHNSDTGYETIKGSVVLNGSKYFRDKDMCLDHINRANAVPLTLDHDTIKAVEAKFVQPTRRKDETFEEYKKRLRQAKMFYDVSLEVMEGIASLSDVLWLTHKFDRRGRCYSSGYHVNPQGTDYNKAVLQFAKKEIVK